MIGERLAELRKDTGLNQQDLADKLGLSLSAISSYERSISSPDDDVKIKLAKMFNISLDYLIGASNDEIPLVREDVITLPKGFPKKSIPKVNEYIRLLMNDHNAKK